MKQESGKTGLASKIVTFLFAATLATAPVAAQTITGVLGSPSATTKIKGNQIPAPEPNFGGVITPDATTSKPWWPPPSCRPRARRTCC